MFIKKLDVVNSALSTIGDAGLTDLQEDHAYRDLILQFLTEVQDEVCSRGWWFNQENTALYPDANSKYVMVPSDVYSVVTPARGYNVAQLGNRMYDSMRRTYEWDRPIPVRLTRKFPFEELPYDAQRAIRDKVIVRFQGRIDADRETKQDCYRAAAESMEELTRKDTQHQKHNMLYRNGMEFNAYLAVSQDTFGDGGIPSPTRRVMF